MKCIWIGLLVSLLCLGGPTTGALDSISPFIRYYEVLSYDREAVHRKHELAKRETSPREPVVPLDFRAFNRNFNIRLRRDATGFANNFEVNVEDAKGTVDLSHIYSGQLEDDEHSSCHGAILQGQFEGSIETANGTYFVEPLDRYSTNQSDHHSIIYHEEDIDDLGMGGGHGGFCGAEQLQRFTQSLMLEEAAQRDPVSRSRRTVDSNKTTCLLHFYADHFYYKRYRSLEAVIGQVALYMKAVNDIYDKVVFDEIKLINFKVKSLMVMPESNSSSPLSRPYVGPEKLLSIYSETNWDEFCLSYLLTNRDYSGLLGLAWEGKPGNSGGICSKFSRMPDGATASLNTGLITLQKYGHYLAPRHVQITLAHELGHSLGAPHDEGKNCGNLGSTGGKGRFLMFPHATDEVQENNDKLSHCSVDFISSLLKIKKDDCFVHSDQPICGNQIREDGEECDVGQNEIDPCCYSAKEPAAVQCRLKPNKLCSPSQGPCCSSSCVFKHYAVICETESECEMTSTCSGSLASCPKPGPKPNMTTCAQNTRVCINGECVFSRCLQYGLQQCDCSEVSATEKCYLCCQEPGKPKTCANTASSVLSKYFHGERVPLVAGAPCFNKRGYCDMFHVCRILDADGPIARLKNAFLHLNDFDDLPEWMEAHWWHILLAICGAGAVMGCIICLCGSTLEAEKEE
ncbi:hypothetical protein GJAV_G00074520 [Gymnothorax javanicus]|nr:hypothetical protein GJAV_G00074520 [Gymnothorax javanicus]